MGHLTLDQFRTLEEVKKLHLQHPDVLAAWVAEARGMEWDTRGHANILVGLAKRGLVERTRRGKWQWWKITEAGLRSLAVGEG